MFIGKQAIKRVGRLKKSIILLCIFTLFILPIANILSAHPALASKDPSRFSNLKENDQYNFYVYASVIANCFELKGLSVHQDVDDQMLTKNEMFRDTAWIYVGTYPNVKSFSKGAINCGDTGFQQEAFNLFGTSPNELMCYMGYPKNGLKGKNDTEAKHEECVALGLTNDFTYSGMPKDGKETFLNALKALTGYDHTKAEKDAYIKYRKYSDWIKGCVDGEATSKSDNTWKVSVVNIDTKKVDRIYKPKGKTEYMYDEGYNKYNTPEFSCKSIESELAIAAKKYLIILKINAVDTACAGLADEKLKACKDGANHKSDTEYCEKTYDGDEEKINACKQGQSAKIEAPEEEEGGEPKNSCGIDGGLGWLICPVMTFVAMINDAAYGAISGFLDIKPAILGDNSNTSGAKQGWDFFRNIANAIFAVIFLWIIFSQISNVGVSNYGIKKILPRLIIGALLVNLSYYLCQIFVDLSNILGHTLKDALEAGAGGIGTESEAAGWSTPIAAILAGGGVVAFAALAIGLPTLAAGFFAIMMVFIILVVRQAGVILLISISPIAFAAWLLPNTEDLFKKWIKMFRGLLLVFPIISLLYGAGKLAGAVLASSATVDPNNPDETLHLVALAATTMPLIATPFVLQNSLSSLGSIGAKIGKMSANAHGRFAGNVKSTAKGRVDNSVIGDTKRKYSDFINRKRASMRAGDFRTKIDSGKVGRFMGWDKGGARARATVAKAFESDVEDASTMLQGMTSDDIAKIANGTDTKASKAMRAAAIDHTMANGSFEERMEVLSSLKGVDTSIKQRAIKGSFAKGDNNIIGNKFGNDILEDKVGNMTDLKNMAIDNAAGGNLQAEHLVQNAAGTEWLVDASMKAEDEKTNKNATSAISNIKSMALKARFNPNTAKNINGKLDSTFRKVGS